MRNGRTGLPSSAVLLSLALLFALVGIRADSTSAQERGVEAGTADAAPEAQPETEAQKLRARLEVLRKSWLSGQARIDSLETDANSAVGDDQLALRRRALELKLERARILDEVSDLIGKLEAIGEDASEARRIVATTLPRLRDAIRSEYARQVAKGDHAKTERAKLERTAGADPATLASLDAKIRSSDAMLLRILAAGIDVAEASIAVGIPSKRQRDWLEEHVRAQARLAVSHVELASERLDDVLQGKTVFGEDSVRQAREAEVKRRFNAALERLESVAGLMERLELDVSQVRKVLVASTGEITVDAIDGAVAGELATRWISELREGVAKNGPRILFQVILFALIASVFWGLSRFVRKVVAHAVAAPNLRFSELLKRMLVTLSTGTVLLLGLLVALSQLGIEVAPMLAGLGIAGFVIGFALQDTLGNFAAGVMILMYRPFDVGDMIDCAGGVFGKVSHMSLVSTTILTIDNKTLIVPNSKIWGDVITNVTAQSIRRVDLEFGIGYSDDIPHAEEVLRAILEEHPKVLAEPEPVVKLHSLGDSSVNFVVRPWVARDDYWDVHWDVTREVKLRFDREGVSIPFPQRDVHFYPTAVDET